MCVRVLLLRGALFSEGEMCVQGVLIREVSSFQVKYVKYVFISIVLVSSLERCPLFLRVKCVFIIFIVDVLSSLERCPLFRRNVCSLWLCLVLIREVSSFQKMKCVFIVVVS